MWRWSPHSMHDVHLGFLHGWGCLPGVRPARYFCINYPDFTPDLPSPRGVPQVNPFLIPPMFAIFPAIFPFFAAIFPITDKASNLLILLKTQRTGMNEKTH